MKKFQATLRNVSSFIAGILDGLSLWATIFAILDAFPDEWQTLPLFGAPIILALGTTLQASRLTGHGRAAGRTRRLEPLPTLLVALNHER